MQEKMKVLLDRIKMEEDYFRYFDNAQITKVEINKLKNSWTFFIDSDDLIKPFLYDHLLDLLEAEFKDISSIEVKFNPKEKDEEKAIDYFKRILDSLKDKVLRLEQFKERNIKIEKNKLFLEVYNKAEKMKFENIKEEIEVRLNNYGLKDIKFKMNINQEESQKVKEEIENTKELSVPKVEKEENKIILGMEIKTKPIPISDIIGEDNNITIECNIFGVDLFESSKTNFKIITLKVTDLKDSTYVKIFTKIDEEFNRLTKKLKPGTWIKVKGYSKNDPYAKTLVMNARDINIIDKVTNDVKDEEENKRVELHAHTWMSQMDGMANVKDLIAQAKKFGHKAIAITDHNSMQAFPDAFNTARDIKIIYGLELNVIEDEIKLVINENNAPIEGSTYVVFDFETTGLNAGSGDSIIEVGAVKFKDGKILDRFTELIDPGKPLPAKITEITGITYDLLKGKRNEEEVIKDFIEFCGDDIMVAHNAKFDFSFLQMCYKKYNLGEFKNPLIDTLELSRMISPNDRRHNLSALVKRYKVAFDEDSHHRADYDAEGTAFVLEKMLAILVNRNINTIDEMKNIIDKEEIIKTARPFHINILAKNNIGLKNLFRILSLASTKYFFKNPRILRSELEKNREGLLFGSSCAQGEVFEMARSKSEEELAQIMQFYDYIEIQPIDMYDHLVQAGEFDNKEVLRSHLLKIINTAALAKKKVVATGDVHHLTPEDKIYRQIIINQRVPGGGMHPLNRRNIKEIPSAHFRTTREMLDDFAFLGEEKSYEIVVTNSNEIEQMIEEVEVIKDNNGMPFTPKMENSAEETKEIVYNKAHEMYGDVLPEIVEERIKKELTGIINGGFDVIYLISQKLVKKSNDDGYIVGSRGSVGSSFVATMMNITEVNPLPAHYRCPKCKKSIFKEDGVSLGSKYSSGFDLPDKVCECGEKMIKDGNDMPFETFLGFNADKVPDIDLNFGGDYQSHAHDYTKVLFGEDYVFRAGTIGTVAEKTAYGFVKGYLEDKEIIKSPAEIERLAKGCVGVKRTTGQHPGGIIVIPDYMDIFDFSPYQYPADDINSKWYTTHFDFNSMHDIILKLDILGHDDPTTIKMLQTLTGVELKDIPFDDKKVLSLFTSPKALGVTEDQIMCKTGTLGIPEFGTKFVLNMLLDTKPTTFGELIKISGLSHGTDVWKNNAELLIQDKVCEFKEVIGCRDDIMVYLMYNGLEPLDAFKIMEFVRKGKASKDPDTWASWQAKMEEKGIVDWYIESCRRIKYMFPKAHATAYVMSAFRIAWFKVYYPLEYYASYFSVRADDFDLDSMVKGAEAIKEKIVEINNKGYDASNKEQNVRDILELSLEMVQRGFSFGQVDLYKSDAFNFIIDEDKKTLIPPFRAIDGLGNVVAQNIVKERDEKKFISIEELQKRGKVSSTLIDKMRLMGILDGMPESAQLTLF